MLKILNAPVYAKRGGDINFDENCALLKLVTEYGILIREKQKVWIKYKKMRFRFASSLDKLFIAVAIIFAMISAVSQPINTLLLAYLLESMVNYGISLVVGNPNGDQFLDDLFWFALYNVILGAFRIRQEYLKASLNQDFGYFDLNKNADIASKINSSLIMALVKGWKLALLCLVSFPITLTLVGLAGFVAARLSKKESVASGKAGSIAEEVLSAIRTVFFGVMTASANFGISSTLMEVFGVARGAGAQIFNLIDNVPTINPLLNRGVTPASIDGNIELKDVLKGVSLSVKRGQSAALVGHSGCGKSTIIQLLSRYYDVIEGSVSVDNNDVRELSVQWLRAQIGLVGQEPVLFNTTVRENIRYGREGSTDEDIEAAARQANAHQFIMKLPNEKEGLHSQEARSNE
ncbi:ATP-binding cassette sub-family B member 1 [Operophtera brumata]|uniref:ATP-binding cassette sub-family B member 1 n=1 Tax=Operophtera brumata TaxID=104452 RepID=A0A0L7L0T8_OPEBR|nr:ATP-binding cassette sub-family B member 1 [Operophtera brumata]